MTPNELRSQLVSDFNLQGAGKSTPLFPQFLVRCSTFKLSGSVGIIVENFVGDPFVFEANNVEFALREMEIAGQVSICLLLTCRMSELTDGFIHLSEDFVARVVPSTGDQKNKLSPEVWWSSWRSLLGDSVSSTIIQAWWGELYAYKRMLECGKKVSWTSLKKGIVDFEGDGWQLEVKSTLDRETWTVRASSALQFVTYEPTKLYLLFLRLKEDHSGSGCSIDQLLVELRPLLANPETWTSIENYLRENGVNPGPLRRLAFSVIDEKAYPVDKDFPRITPNSFRGDEVPKGTSGLAYDIRLESVIGAVSFEQFIKDS